MLILHNSRLFSKDMERAKKQGRDCTKLRAIIDLLNSNQALPLSLKDHPLKGKWKGYRDLHIAPDWVLIYKIDAQNLWLTRMGSHADLFK